MTEENLPFNMEGLKQPGTLLIQLNNFVFLWKTASHPLFQSFVQKGKKVNVVSKQIFTTN